MNTSVQQWGNSVALCIPKSFADQVNIRRGSSVRLTLERGRLIVTPEPSGELSLKKLLAKVTPQNVHAESD